MVWEDVDIAVNVMLHLSPSNETAKALSPADSPDGGRRGRGRMYMEVVERMASDGGAWTILPCVRPGYREAVNLYLSQVNKVLARFCGYYEDGADADMMVKHLE